MVHIKVKNWIKANKICASIALCYGNANLESILLEMLKQPNNAVLNDRHINFRFRITSKVGKTTYVVAVSEIEKTALSDCF